MLPVRYLIALVLLMAAPAWATVEVQLMPSSQTVNLGDTVSVNIVVVASGTSVDGVDASINYNPGFLSVVSVTPVLTTFDQVLHTNFSVPGQIDYSSGTFGAPATGTFTVATILFQTISGPGVVILSFNQALPRKTDTALLGVSNLTTVQGATITILVTSPTTTHTVTQTPTPSTTPTITLTPTTGPTGTPHYVGQEAVAAPATPFTPTNTPAGTLTPTATPASTGTPIRVGQEESVPSTSTPSGSPTTSPTPTPTNPIPIGCVTFTPTPLCGTVEIVGQVLDTRGFPAANRRVTFETRHVQGFPNGCVIRPSLFTIKTDVNGMIPPHTTLICQSVVLITLENGVASEVTIPCPGPVNIGILLYHKATPTPANTSSPTMTMTFPPTLTRTMTPVATSTPMFGIGEEFVLP